MEEFAQIKLDRMDSIIESDSKKKVNELEKEIVELKLKHADEINELLETKIVFSIDSSFLGTKYSIKGKSTGDVNESIMCFLEKDGITISNSYMGKRVEVNGIRYYENKYCEDAELQLKKLVDEIGLLEFKKKCLEKAINKNKKTIFSIFK